MTSYGVWRNMQISQYLHCFFRNNVKHFILNASIQFRQTVNFDWKDDGCTSDLEEFWKMLCSIWLLKIRIFDSTSSMNRFESSFKFKQKTWGNSKGGPVVETPWLSSGKQQQAFICETFELRGELKINKQKWCGGGSGRGTDYVELTENWLKTNKN